MMLFTWGRSQNKLYRALSVSVWFYKGMEMTSGKLVVGIEAVILGMVCTSDTTIPTALH